MGWYQFAPGTLSYLGYDYITPAKFKRNPDIFPPEMQVEVLKALIRCNEAELERYICYVGKKINGITITKSGLLAGAHIGGARGVKLYLLSDGKINRRDMNGTTIGRYIKVFQGYELDYVRVQTLYRTNLNKKRITHIISGV